MNTLINTARHLWSIMNSVIRWMLPLKKSCSCDIADLFLLPNLPYCHSCIQLRGVAHASHASDCFLGASVIKPIKMFSSIISRRPQLVGTVSNMDIAHVCMGTVSYICLNGYSNLYMSVLA